MGDVIPFSIDADAIDIMVGHIDATIIVEPIKWNNEIKKEFERAYNKSIGELP